jgi:2-alkyl-3-oxoalkanoate reductase
MNILVTGASGFLGRYTVAELLRRGHHVRALVRPSTPASKLPCHSHPTLKLVRLDLSQLDQPDQGAALQGVDVVVHLAAAKTGDLQTQLASTVTATESLLKGMTQAGLRRLVAISTFSVYDYLHLPTGTILDENTPLETNPAARDIYAQTKLIQEARIQQFGQQGGAVTVLRPGIVYGQAEGQALWNASLGIKKGQLWLQIGGDATLPLTYVENCAAAIANAVERDAAIGQTLNIIDDDLPTQSQYIQALLTHMAARTVTIPWSTMQRVANLASQLNRLSGERLKLPGLLIPARLHARFKPLQYSNAQAKQILAWTPQYSLETALARSYGPDLLAVQFAPQF